MLESQVLEMWGFAITTLKVGLKQTTLHWKMMCQIPYDEEPPEGPEHFIMHYTYGMVGPLVWAASTPVSPKISLSIASDIVISISAVWYWYRHAESNVCIDCHAGILTEPLAQSCRVQSGQVNNLLISR